MTQTYLNYAWITLFLIITILRKWHEQKAGRYSSLKNNPIMESILMLLWGIAAGVMPFIYIFSPWINLANYPAPIPMPLGIIGVILFVIAIWLLHRSHADLGNAWSPSTSPIEKSLVTNGIFKLIRHPMYSAHIIWGIAQTLLFPNWLAGPLALILIGFVLTTRIPREEKSLLMDFGSEYRHYMNKTGRFFPKIKRDKK